MMRARQSPFVRRPTDSLDTRTNRRLLALEAEVAELKKQMQQLMMFHQQDRPVG